MSRVADPHRQSLFVCAEAASGDDPEQMHQRIQTAIDDVDQLLATFSALLRIARIESGGHADRKEKVSLARLVKDAVEFYQVVADQQRIKLTSDLPGEPKIIGDRDLIFQLITNLIDNALKYTPDGGNVHLAVHQHNFSNVLSVSDSGCGIPAEQHEFITQRFYRVNKSRQHMGSGLGLSLVQAVADYHGAALCFANNAPGLRVDVAFPKDARD